MTRCLVRQVNLGDEKVTLARKPSVGTLRATVPRPAELGQRSEASLAYVGTTRPAKRRQPVRGPYYGAPEMIPFAGADVVKRIEGRLAAPQSARCA
jgi:hypothetical protein